MEICDMCMAEDVCERAVEDGAVIKVCFECSCALGII